MCKSIPKVEWSGVLFYSVIGSIKDPSTFKIEIEDILPLDVGTQTFTSYDLDDRFIDYLMEDPKRMKYKVGHIHSHNVMNVFFSHTDMEELNDSCPAYNYYLSLIVNNYMEMTAKVAFISNASATIQKVDYFSLDEAGKPYAMEQKDFTFEKEKMYVYNCGITVPKIDIIVEESFADKVKKILIPKPVIKPVVVPTKHVAGKSPHMPLTVNNKPDINSKFKDFFNGVDFQTLDTLEDEEEEDDYEEKADKLQIFTTSLFSNSTQPLADESLEDALLALLDSEVEPLDIAQKALLAYAETYFAMFPENDDTEFIIDCYEVLDLLYDLPNTMTVMINPTIKVIELMVKTFEKDARTV